MLEVFSFILTYSLQPTLIFLLISWLLKIILSMNQSFLPQILYYLRHNDNTSLVLVTTRLLFSSNQISNGFSHGTRWVFFLVLVHNSFSWILYRQLVKSFHFFFKNNKELLNLFHQSHICGYPCCIYQLFEECIFSSSKQRKDRPICAHCNIVEHTVDKCYKVQAYPPSYKTKQQHIINFNFSPPLTQQTQ